MALEIVVPELGESVTEATVAKWFKSVGDAVAVDEPLVELETDKVTLEVNAGAGGILEEITAAEGDDVVVGALLGRIGEAGAQPAAQPTAAQPATSKGNGEIAAPTAAAPEPAAPENAAPETAAAKTGGTVEIVVPELGESVTEASVAKWFKSVGDAVAVDDPLVELETDKVTLEVNAPASGTLSDIQAREGADVSVGAVLGTLATGVGATGVGASGAVTTGAGARVAEPAPAAEAMGAVGNVPAPAMPMPPSVNKLVAEHELDPAAIPASGKDGRLTKGDVLAYLETDGGATAEPVAKPAAATPPPPPAQPIQPDPRGEERVRMTRLRQRIAERLKQAQNTAAMLTTFNEVDMGAVMDARKLYKEAFEKKHGVKLGFMSFFTKACIVALKELPAVNAQIDGEDIVYKNYYDIGVAIGTERGLVVPVLRDADALSFAGIEARITDLGTRARAGKLTMDELTGGTFTITNGGIYGSLMSTPILNPPQSGILGMHKIQPRPMALGEGIEVRPMMYLALSYDHRIVDGREAVTFLVRIKESLEDPQRILLEM